MCSGMKASVGPRESTGPIGNRCGRISVMASAVAYPFVPKSTRNMVPGQFWSIPLPGRHFACGRVLQLKEERGKRDSRIFLAGLLDWIGVAPPTSEAISGARLLAHGAAHIKTISANHGEILGCRELALDGLVVPLTLSEHGGSTLQQGFRLVGTATPQQHETLGVFSVWGFHVIVALAEDLLRGQAGGT